MASPVMALESPWRSADYLQARLISGVSGAGAEESLPAALELRLAEGWHAYWRTPGDAGLPPSLDWAGSENLREAVMEWPAPHRIEIMGLQSFGYTGTVIFPLNLKPQTPGKPVDLNLNSTVMVCKDICVPQEVSLHLDIPGQSATPGAYAAVIAKARDNVPRKEAMAGLRIDSAVIGPDALVVRAWSQAGFEGADLFVEAGDVLLTARPRITPDEKDSRAATLLIPKPEGMDNLAHALMNASITLTLSASGNAIEKTISF